MLKILKVYACIPHDGAHYICIKNILNIDFSDETCRCASKVLCGSVALPPSVLSSNLITD